MLIRRKGFSLVELVVVIVVLGLLSVAALPKFLDITEEAKRSAFVAHVSSFQSGLTMVRSQHELKGKPESIAIHGERLQFSSVEGVIENYPTALTASDCGRMWNIVLGGTRATEQGDLLQENMMLATFDDGICSFDWNEFGSIDYLSGDGGISAVIL